MENTYKSQRCRKFPGVHKLLSKIYLKFQLYSKTTEWIKKKEEMDMEWGTQQGLQETQGKDNKLTSTLSFKERRKI